MCIVLGPDLLGRHGELIVSFWLQARRFPEGSETKLLYEVGLQALLISFVIVTLIAGVNGHQLLACSNGLHCVCRMAMREECL